MIHGNYMQLPLYNLCDIVLRKIKIWSFTVYVLELWLWHKKQKTTTLLPLVSYNTKVTVSIMMILHAVITHTPDSARLLDNLSLYAADETLLHWFRELIIRSCWGNIHGDSFFIQQHHKCLKTTPSPLFERLCKIVCMWQGFSSKQASCQRVTLAIMERKPGHELVMAFKGKCGLSFQ